MPPTRNQSRMGPPPAATASKPGEQFQSRRSAANRAKKGMVKPSPLRNSPMMEHVGKEDNLRRLRVPSKLLHSLPSVKKYQDSQDFVDLTEISSEGGDSVGSRSDTLEDTNLQSVSKKARISLGKTKYLLAEVAEERFLGIIWDVAMSPISKDVLVACCDGLFLCHEDLSQKKKLEKIILPGGVDFLEDGTIVALCRNTDTLNIFTHDGSHRKTFQCGKSPMTVAVTQNNQVAVSDPSEKCIHIYDVEQGLCTSTIKWESKGSGFMWPLYLAYESDKLLVVDVHAQRLMEFCLSGRHLKDFRLKMNSGHELLRPHGLCVHPQNHDVFVIDTALDTVEAFSENDQFLQNILSMDDGHLLKPKCLSVSRDGEYLIVGGRTGKVRIYQFWEENAIPLAGSVKSPEKSTRIKEEKPSVEQQTTPEDVIVLD